MCVEGIWVNQDSSNVKVLWPRWQSFIIREKMSFLASWKKNVYHEHSWDFVVTTRKMSELALHCLTIWYRYNGLVIFCEDLLFRFVCHSPATQRRDYLQRIRIHCAVFVLFGQVKIPPCAAAREPRVSTPRAGACYSARHPVWSVPRPGRWVPSRSDLPSRTKCCVNRAEKPNRAIYVSLIEGKPHMI